MLMRNVSIAVTSVTTAILMSGCAAPRVGHSAASEFATQAVEIVLASSGSAGEVARCFENEARLLPLSSIRYEPDLQQTTYRLQGFGLWLEQASFRDLPQGGSEVQFRYAQNYDRRWLQNVERDRLAPLRRCAEQVS